MNVKVERNSWESQAASGATIAATIFMSLTPLRRSRARAFIASSLAAAALAFGQGAFAQNPVIGASRGSSAIPPPSVAASAGQLLKQMGAYLGSAEQFTFRADITFEHVLPSGQKLQFSATENVALQRPNGLYVEWNGNLGDRQFWYDGQKVTIYDPDAGFYATDAAPSAIDAMLDKLITQLNFTPPLADFLSSDPYKSVDATIQYGFSVGDTEINGRNCQALAFVEQHIDWQIWIDNGPQPVPCKLVITYKNNSSLPQFSAIFSDWDFAPRIAARTFTPDVPPGAEAIPFENVTAATSPK